MCGIFASTSCKHVNISYFDLLNHRGPDYTSYMTIPDTEITFGFHRLAIVDTSPISNQPLHIDDIWLICNGEIFNHKKLEEKYDFQTYTGSDCEVIIHLYKHYGRGINAIKKIVEKIKAEFAFILVDKKTNDLFAVRDPFGIRPMFYGIDQNNYFFASELKSLGFLSCVSHILPSNIYHILLDTRELSIIPYYHISLEKIHPEPSLQDIHKNINQILRQSVALRLMSDRPVGCFLSGGVDSSLITALVSEHIPNLHCFTIGLNESSEDIIAAKKVVSHLNSLGRNITHHIVYFTIEEGFNALRNVIYHLETYDITTIRASVPQYLLSKYIKQNTDIVVLYSGEGADECMASYLYNRFAPNAQELELDSKRLLEELYMFDNLRVDRTTSAFSLEVRIPFLDTCFVDYIFSLNPEHRMCNNKMEKLLLRDSFKDDNLLPKDVLYRTKAAFSDAVSSSEVSWYKSLQGLISDKEAIYYRNIFSELFPNRYNILSHYWLPKWIDTNGDPSATVFI
jgi:asparagine synthase (glutamine-hydrolysing)